MNNSEREARELLEREMDRCEKLSTSGEKGETLQRTMEAARLSQKGKSHGDVIQTLHKLREQR